MSRIYTIGFTKKTAEEFFTLLEENNIQKLIDIRLSNNSQLAAFSKFPDIEFFLKRLCNIAYIHDPIFAPSEKLLNSYKKRLIDWVDYEIEFSALMGARNIKNYIVSNYSDCDNCCLLCSEPTPENCHRRLVAEIFAKVLKNVEIVHL